MPTRQDKMKKLLILGLTLLMALSVSPAMGEGGPLLPEEEERADVEIRVPSSIEYLDITPPEGVELITKREGDITTITVSGPVDEIYVSWHDGMEQLDVVEGVAQYSHTGHPYQEGVIWCEKEWYYITSFDSSWTEEEIMALLEKYENYDMELTRSETGWDVWQVVSFSYGEEAYDVRIGSSEFVYGRDGQSLSIYDGRLGSGFFLTGEDGVLSLVWQRGASGEWYISSIEEYYETGVVSSVTANYRNDEEKSLFSYTVTYADGEENLYMVQYDANDKLTNAWALVNGKIYMNGSGDYSERWVNKTTGAWASDESLRPVEDFAVSPREKAAFTEGKTPLDELIHYLTALLETKEQIYSCKIESLDAIATYLEQIDYASLVNARIVCSQSLRCLNGITVPAFELSDAAITQLYKRGVEVSAVEIEFLSLADDLRDNLIPFLEMALYTDVYHLSSIDLLRSMELIHQELFLLMRNYDCLFINAMLIPYQDDAAVKQFWQSLPERFPTIGSCIKEWEEDAQKLEREGNLLLDNYELLITDYSEVSEQYKQSAERFVELATLEDYDAIQEDVAVISGMPAMVPFPYDWLYCEDSVLYVGERDKSGMPSQLSWATENVPLDSYLAYIDYLQENYGATLYANAGNDETGWNTELEIEGYVLYLEWTPYLTARVTYNPHELSMEDRFYILFEPSKNVNGDEQPSGNVDFDEHLRRMITNLDFIELPKMPQ